ncbi:putative glycolipid-binding domain-containing protein [Lysinimonas soli]|uniref:Glycolipid-binding domain-containing protein n=1 Tax=Lysinimonas soli TaxID=1074233 RepID=A0ABW0NPB2_9MICO
MADFVWRGIEIDSLERLHVEEGPTVRAQSVIDSARGRFSYELVCDRDWTFRRLRLEAATGERALEVESDGKGEWTVDGEWRSDLDECIDVDLSGTPFTNSLPIRRLDLAIGEEADLVMAYIDFEDLTVLPDAQRYTRLDEDLYRYESLDSDFSRDITVDLAGFVVEYPGLFERL